MALSEFEQKRCEKIVGAFIESRRPGTHVRPKLDLGFRINGQSVEIFEIRPRFDSPKEKLEHSVAKATFVKSTGAWRVFWQRSDLKWHRYEPAPEVATLEDFVKLISGRTRMLLGLTVPSNNKLESDRGASWPHRARNGLRARRCGIGSRPAAQQDR